MPLFAIQSWFFAWLGFPSRPNIKTQATEGPGNAEEGEDEILSEDDRANDEMNDEGVVQDEGVAVDVKAIKGDAAGPVTEPCITGHKQVIEDDEMNTIQSPLPAWFLENCVKTAKELQDANLRIAVRGAFDVQREEDRKDDVFEIEPVMYNHLHSVLSDHKNRSGSDKTQTFTITRLLLDASHDGSENGTSDFLDNVVQLLAKDIDANLITFSFDDIEDLAQYHGHFLKKIGSPSENLRTYVGERQTNKTDDQDSLTDSSSSQHDGQLDSLIDPTYDPPLNRIFDSLVEKSPDDEHELAEKLLIIHIREIHQFNRPTKDIHVKILDSLANTASSRDKERRKTLLVLSSATMRLYPPWSRTLAELVSFDGNRIKVLPVRSEHQLRNLYAGLPGTNALLSHNARMLRRGIREITGDFEACEIQPYTAWAFLADAEGRETIEGRALSPSEVAQLASLIGKNYQEDHIIQVLVNSQSRIDLLAKWNDTKSNRWSSFPRGVQAKIREIESGGEDFKWEKRFLDLLVMPDKLTQGWNDIVLDVDTKDAIIQILNNPKSSKINATSILRKSHSKGALLYGPPGTGKTQLARVVARECLASMICVSAADILSKWVGENEKAIQGLFKLGRYLSPAIIFVDEADTLFRARQLDDRSWERAIVNQLLGEMDGLTKSDDAPFVLLATNFPQSLDAAVLRRVSGFFHIGLPDSLARAKILEISLRGEIHTEVNIQMLVEKTQGYSGADIQRLCYQAALACESTSSIDNGRLVLRNEHFDKALRRCRRTVTQKCLNGIQQFIKNTTPKIQESSYDSNQKPTVVGRGINAHPASPVVSDLRLQTSTSTGQNPLKPKNRTIPQLLNAEETTALGEASVPIDYAPLSASQIRVLSLDPYTGESRTTSSEPHILSCRLDTVSLDDKTFEYKLTAADRSGNSSDTNGHGLRDTPPWWVTQALMDQALLSFKGEGIINSPEDCPGVAGDQIPSALGPFKHKSLDEILKTRPRFNWGDYIAMSYVWGDPERNKTILVNGKKTAVTTSLHVVLQRLTQSMEVRERQLKIWIDGLSINQDDVTEKEREIPKMHLIYTEALAVRAWLGDAPPITDSQARMVRTVLNKTADLIFSGTENTYMMYKSVSSSLPKDITDCAWAMYQDLLRVTFWVRIWTMQECMMATSLLYWYGPWELSSTDLTLLSNLLNHGRIDYSLRLTSRDNELAESLPRQDVMLTRNRNWKKYSIDLPHTLILCKKSHATDLRDKVYGVLGILPHQVAQQIKPDYSKDYNFWDAYRDLSKAIISQDNGLSTRSVWSLQVCDEYHGPSSFPSWAFDLSTPMPDPLSVFRSIKMDSDGQSSGRLPFNANRWSKSIPKFVESIMKCEGMFIEVILNATHEFRYNGPRVKDVFCPDLNAEAIIISETSKLALARALHLNCNIELSEERCVLSKMILNPNDPFNPIDPLDGNADAFGLRTITKSLQLILEQNALFHIRGAPLWSYFTSGPPGFPTNIHEAFQWYEVIIRLTHCRLFTTKTGSVGMAPLHSRPGDRIAVLLASSMPVVLRQVGDQYHFIGGCFIDGWMQGEAINAFERGELEKEDILIT